jgi:opacity protein-like surface antigen
MTYRKTSSSNAAMSCWFPERHNQEGIIMATQNSFSKSNSRKSLYCVLIMTSLPLGAAEWSVEPSIAVSTTYSDNVRLLSQSTVAEPIQSNVIVSVSPALLFGLETEVRKVTGKLRVAANRFNKDKDLDSNDAFFDISWSEKGERSEFSLVSNNTFDSTLSSQLEATGNRTDERKQRQKISVNPSYAYNYDARLTLALGYRYEDVGFRDSAGTALVDYRSNELLPALRYKLDERNELQVNTRLWQLITVPSDLDKSRSTFKSGLVNFLYNQALDESHNWSAGAGFYSINENTTGNRNNPFERTERFSGATALAKYQTKNEYGALSFIAAREVNPSGENTLLLTNRVGVDYTQGVTSYVNAGISAGYYKNTIVGGADEKDSQYFRISPNLRWKPAREWQIDGGMSFQRAKSMPANGAETTASAKSAFLNLVYFWNKAAISR